VLLGIDVGTGSSKGVLVERDGTILASAVIEHEMSVPGPGRVEFDARTAWAELGRIARELLVGHDPALLDGVCVSAMGPCLVLTGDEFEPLRPTILYGVDSRAEAQIAELNSTLGEDEIYAACGKALSTQAVGPKLRWVREEEPDVFAASTRMFGLSSWLVAKLTGEYTIDHHTASQCDPLYDLAAADWHEEWAPLIAEHIPLPRLAWPADVVGRVTAAAALESGIPVGTPVCAGTVDAWAEATSAGVRSPGDLMLMYGSTLFFVEVLEGYAAHPKLWTTRGVESGSFTLAAGMSTSGTLTQWIQQLTGGASFEDLVAEAEDIPAGSDGLLLLPYFAGERTPIFDPAARGVIAGLSLQHGRGHLFRAAYEGIAYGIRQIVAFLDSTAEPVQRIVAVGGGTRARLWMQIVSDVTGRPQDVPERTIGASYGDAMLAGIGTGAAPDAFAWARVAETIQPDLTRSALYDELFSAYESLYPATREHMHLLAAVQQRGAAATNHADPGGTS
jgi:xylulokinase